MHLCIGLVVNTIMLNSTYNLLLFHEIAVSIIIFAQLSDFADTTRVMSPATLLTCCVSSLGL